MRIYSIDLADINLIPTKATTALNFVLNKWTWNKNEIIIYQTHDCGDLDSGTLPSLVLRGQDANPLKEVVPQPIPQARSGAIGVAYTSVLANIQKEFASYRLTYNGTGYLCVGFWKVTVTDVFTPSVTSVQIFESDAKIMPVNNVSTNVPIQQASQAQTPVF